MTEAIGHPPAPGSGPAPDAPPNDDDILSSLGQGLETRRSMIKKVAIAGTAAWVAPTVLWQSPAAAQTSACACVPESVAFAATCQPQYLAPDGDPYHIPGVYDPLNPNSHNPDKICVYPFDVTQTVCVGGDPSQAGTVVFARDAAGQFEPYGDDVIYVHVTPISSSGPTVTWTLRRWPGTVGACPDVGTLIQLESPSPPGGVGCPPDTTETAVDITGMFQHGCGQYSVQVQVANSFTAYAWSALYIVPM